MNPTGNDGASSPNDVAGRATIVPAESQAAHLALAPLWTQTPQAPGAPAGAKYWVVGVVSSGALHLAAAVLAGALFGGAMARVEPPRSGVHSLQLAASFAAPAPDVPPVLEIALESHEEVELPDSPASSHADPRPRNVASERLPTAASGDPAAWPIAPTPREPPVAETMPELPRTPDEPLRRSLTELPTTNVRSQPPQRTPVANPPRTTPPTAAVAQLESHAQTGAEFDTAPAKRHSPPPIYPPLALQRGWQGRVILRVKVDAAGRVERVELHRSSGFGSLDRAAREAVQRWHFEPARKLGRAVSAEIAVPIRFVIQQPEG